MLRNLKKKLQKYEPHKDIDLAEEIEKMLKTDNIPEYKGKVSLPVWERIWVNTRLKLRLEDTLLIHWF